MSAPKPGWYADPAGHGVRWWDGNEWTGYFRPAGSHEGRRLAIPVTWLVPAALAVGLGIALVARG